MWWAVRDIHLWQYSAVIWVEERGLSWEPCSGRERCRACKALELQLPWETPAGFWVKTSFLAANFFEILHQAISFSTENVFFVTVFLRQKPYFPLKKKKKKIGQLYFWSYFWRSHEMLVASIGHCVTRDQPRNSRLPANLVLLSLPQRGVGSLEFCIIKERIKSYLQPIRECWIYSIRISWLISQW